jgi:hypothetical protein
MFQLSITLFIVTMTAGMAVYLIIRHFKEPSGKCAGCEKSGNGCPLDDLSF